MAITDIDISETLEAGAPSIKYTGNRDPNEKPNMQVASDPSWEAEWEDLYQSYKLKQIQLGQEFVDKETFMDQYQNNMASGGRVNFGLGSIFKGIKKAVKSPVGKAALLGLGAYGTHAGWFGPSSWKGWGSKIGPALFGTKSAGIGALSGHGPGLWSAAKASTPGLFGKLGLTKGAGSMMPTALGWGAGLVTAGAAATAFEGMDEEEVKALRSNPEALRAHLTQYYSNVNPDLGDEEVSAWVETQMYSTGGRVGLRDGSDDMTISTSQRDPKNMTTVAIISIIKEGRSTPEMFQELRLRGVKGVDEIELAEGQGDVGYSFDERLVDEYNPKTGTSQESFLMNLRESNPDVYGKYRRPQNYPEAGPSTMNKNYREENFYAEPTWMKAEGGRIGFMGAGIAQEPQGNPHEKTGGNISTHVGHTNVGGGDGNIGGNEPLVNPVGPNYPAVGPLFNTEKNKIKNRLDKLIAWNDEYNAKKAEETEETEETDEKKKAMKNVDFISTEHSPYKKAASSVYDHNQKLLAKAKELGYKSGGRIGFAFGPDQTAQAAGIMGQLPVRKNGAGVKELDLRDSGGFIPPVGVKEKADDIPAMLSNNEFVMTADAVRAAGGGSVEKGAQVMYDQMKNLESRVV